MFFRIVYWLLILNETLRVINVFVEIKVV